MNRNHVIAAIVMAVALLAGARGPFTVTPAYAACDAGDHIDKSTATDAKKKITAAGYTQVRDLKKGCDNFWHAAAMKDNAPVNVVVSPQGEVMTEGN